MAFPTSLTKAQDRNVVKGICTTNGTAVSRVSGDAFTSILCGTIEIGGSVGAAGVLYAISSITDANHLILAISAGVQIGVYFTAALEIKAAHLNALETKVGIDGSIDPDSLDYRVEQLENPPPPPSPIAGVVQKVCKIYSAFNNPTPSAIPWGDSLPQPTEGFEFMVSDDFTPIDGANILLVTVFCNAASHAAGSHIIGALFKDDDVNAFAAAAQDCATPDNEVVLTFIGKLVAPGAGPFIFKFRASASGSQMFFNGSGNQKFGGVSASSITIEEVNA